mgnify:CR=1 FL=1
MTKSKIPGGSSKLDDSLNQLDDLLKDTNGETSSPAGSSGIPVLDELIDADDLCDGDEAGARDIMAEHGDALQALEGITQEQVDHIMGNVEAKLADELDALVHILKDSIKDTIMTEIKTQLESGLKKS